MWPAVGVATFERTEAPGPGWPRREVRLRTLALLVVLPLFAACGPSKELEVKRAQLLAERRDLVATFDHLEDRLVVNQARVRFWREMRERHEGATAARSGKSQVSSRPGIPKRPNSRIPAVSMTAPPAASGR